MDAKQSPHPPSQHKAAQNLELRAAFVEGAAGLALTPRKGAGGEGQFRF
ncbi:hypothetical protein GFS31_30230 [Leptolyngbya sp. BL0902]|nr:hypothetical protein GFS31_30230 [Leptolyngbya sp. BL0902]